MHPSLTLVLDPRDPFYLRVILALLVEAAREAGAGASAFFEQGGRTRADVRMKAGNSPVTEADDCANRILERRLRAAIPDAAWMSEESADDPVRLGRGMVIVVDPIDGTRGFIDGDPRWTVCVALVIDGRTSAGVVHAPALAETYAAMLGQGATLNGITIAADAKATLDGSRAGGPKPMIEAIARASGAAIECGSKIPSLAYRLVQVAAGRLDVAAAARGAHDWDIAAADLIVHEAGGRLTTRLGERPLFNRESLLHRSLFAASATLHPALIAAAARER